MIVYTAMGDPSISKERYESIAKGALPSSTTSEHCPSPTAAKRPYIVRCVKKRVTRKSSSHSRVPFVAAPRARSLGNRSKPRHAQHSPLNRRFEKGPLRSPTRPTKCAELAASGIPRLRKNFAIVKCMRWRLRCRIEDRMQRLFGMRPLTRFARPYSSRDSGSRTGGAQPMTAPGRGTLVYNGELFATSGLRERLLAKGVPLRGTGDTELLLTRFLNGASLVCSAHFVSSHLRILITLREGSIARDRMGIRPFYFARLQAAICLCLRTKRAPSPRLDWYGATP